MKKFKTISKMFTICSFTIYYLSVTSTYFLHITYLHFSLNLTPLSLFLFLLFLLNFGKLCFRYRVRFYISLA